MASTGGEPIRIVGRYALYGEIAAGGMATVHIGRLLGPVGFARTVAVKRLHPQYAKDPEFVSMFLDEARLASRVQHPNVVATIDVVATDGELFLVMDYVRGESLARLLRSARKLREPVPPRIATAIMCGFLHGLHAAHEAKNERGEALQLVHRDVSPQNVLVGVDGIPRVLDFGIAKAAGRIQITKDGSIKGKLGYMPPEQITGRSTSRTVDVYAAGVVAWEILTGERLFNGENEGQMLSKILMEDVVAPSVQNPAVPAAFDEPILRALSRKASLRQQTARELALDLEKCVGIASPSEVGEWVEKVGRPELSKREEQVAAIESGSTNLHVAISPSGHPVPHPPDPISEITQAPLVPRRAVVTSGGRDSVTTGTQAPAVTLQSAPERETLTETSGTMPLPLTRRNPVFGILIGLALLLVIGGVVVTRLVGGDHRPTPNGNASGSGSASAANPAIPDPREIPPVPTLEPSVEPSQSAAVPTATATATATATIARPPPPTATTTVTKPKPPATANKASCDPPWVIDDKGLRQYKRECLGN